MKRQWVILLLATTISVCGPAYGQTWDRMQTGIAPSASYFHGGIDSIHLANGNLFLDIPLISLPGRELGTGLRLTYNSQKKSYVWPYGPLPGWQISDPIGDLPIYVVNQAHYGQLTQRHVKDGKHWNYNIHFPGKMVNDGGEIT